MTTLEQELEASIAAKRKEKGMTLEETLEMGNAATPLTPPPELFTEESRIDELAGALAKAQAEMKSPPRNRTVRVQTKTGAAYSFKYATLDGIIEAVRAPLAANGLSFAQLLESADGGYWLVTTLMHASGQSLTSRTKLLVQGTGNQEFGSALTYMRRYALTALLGVAADEDDDGNAADGNRSEEVAPRARGDNRPPAKPKADLKKANIWTPFWVKAGQLDLSKNDIHQHFGVGEQEGLVPYAEARAAHANITLQQTVEEMTQELDGIGAIEAEPSQK